MYEKIGGYPEHILYASDYGYWLKAGIYTKFANIPEYAIVYNSRKGNTSHIHYWEQQMESLSLVLQYRDRYPDALKLLSKKPSIFLYALCACFMEKHTPLIKDEIRKML